MSTTQTSRITVRLKDNQTYRFEFPPNQEEFGVVARIEKALQSGTLAIEAQGRLLVFPMSSVLSIEVNPAPEQLPDIVIQNAQLAA